MSLLTVLLALTIILWGVAHIYAHRYLSVALGIVAILLGLVVLLGKSTLAL